MEERQDPPQNYIPILQPVEPEPPVEVFPIPRKQRGFTWIAWIAIVALVVVIVILQNVKREDRAEDTPVTTAGRPDPVNVMQGRYAVGVKNALPVGDEANPLLDQLNSWRHGPLVERLSFVTVVGEFHGPAEALKELQSVQSAVRTKELPVTKEDDRLLTALNRLYEEYAHLRKASLAQADRTLIESRLGWFGELALAPRPLPAPNPDLPGAVGAAPALILTSTASRGYLDRDEVIAPAIRTFATAAGVFTGVLGLALLGFIGLCILAYRTAAGTAGGGLTRGSGNAGIYAETFALWLLVFFFGMQTLLGLVPDDYRLFGSVAGFFLSLVVLAWPVVRGVPFSTMLEEIGLTTHGKPLSELFWGIGCYVMALPFVIIGVILVFILILVYQAMHQAAGGEGDGSPLEKAAHPIAPLLANPDWLLLLQIFLAACVAAPIVEETMFRGVLYRHLREITRRWGFVLSALCSALLTSFIFAVIHPQGFIAVPLLMSLAFGINIFREWRDSLVPCMVAHGISNCLVLTVTLLLMS